MPSLKTFHLLALAGLLLLAGCNNPDKPADFHRLDGQPGHYADFNGRWLLINYWAEWCKPCIEEIPELNAFAAAHEDVAVIGIHYDAPPAERQQQLAGELGIAFAVIRGQPHRHFNYDLPNVLPTTAVINPQGRLVTLLKGPQDKASLAAAIGR
ncbi:MAG TPA: TlpA disulfide reductase family protein [Pseudomonadales bacterium]